MINTRFEVYKLKRELKRNGTYLEFTRNTRNEFGELSGDPVTVGELVGLYHETNSYIQIASSDGTVSRSVKTPMLLCLVSDVKALGIEVGDYVTVPNAVTGKTKTYFVTGTTDVMDFGLIADISLEVIDDGTVC